MDKEVKHITITRKELEKLSASYKKENAGKVVLIVENRYRIFVDGLYTSAERENDPMVTLREGEMPQYVRDFVF